MDDVLGNLKQLYGKVSARRGEALVVDTPERSDRDQAFVDQQLSPSFGERVVDVVTRPTALGEMISGVKPTPLMQELSELKGQVILKRRKQQRDYAEQADPEMRKKTEDILKYITNSSNRFGATEALNALPPEEQEEVMRLAPGVMQQLGDDRGNIAWRALNAAWKGINDIAVNPIAEMTGLSGSPEDIDRARYLESLRQQEAGPTRGDDPWYAQGALGAVEQAPYALGTAKLAGLGGKALSTLGGSVLGKTAATTIGSTAGVMTGTFPSAYTQSYHELKEMGMPDDWRLRGVAAGVGLSTGFIESAIPDIFPGKVKLTQGLGRAISQHFLEAAKKFPVEIGEEGAQAMTNELAKVIVSWSYDNIEDKSIRDAVVAGIDGLEESVLPMIFLMGVPAAGAAAMSSKPAIQQTKAFNQQVENASPETIQGITQRLQGLQDAKTNAPERVKQLNQIASKGFVSEDDAKKFGIAGESRKDRMKAVYSEIDQLNNMEMDAEIEYLQDLVGRWQESGKLTTEGMNDEVQLQSQEEQGIEVPTQTQEQASEEKSPIDQLRDNTSKIKEQQASRLDDLAQRQLDLAQEMEDSGDVESATSAREQAAKMRAKSEEMRQTPEATDQTTPVAEEQATTEEIPVDEGQLDAELGDLEEDSQPTEQATPAVESQEIESLKRRIAQYEQRLSKPYSGNSQAVLDKYDDQVTLKSLQNELEQKRQGAKEATAVEKQKQSPVIGEPVSLMGNNYKRSESVDDEDGIRYELFEGADGKTGAVRQMDMDSGNVVSLVSYPTMDRAKAEFEKFPGVKTSRPQPVTPSALPDPERDQFVARIEKNYGYKLTPREPKNADEQEQMEFLSSRGKKATFVDADDPGFNGVVDHKTGHILIAGGRDTNDIWNTIGHELAHETGLDKIVPGDSVELSELKTSRLQTSNNKFRKFLESNSEALDREARAEMVGQFMRDKSFRNKLARSNPTMWESLRDAILKLIGKWTPKNEAQAMVLKELRQEKAPSGAKSDQQSEAESKTDAKPDENISVDEFANVFANPEQAKTPKAKGPKNRPDKTTDAPKKPRSLRKDAKKGVEDGLREAKEGADLIRKGLKDLGALSLPNPPINADIARGLGMMANGLIKAGKYKFIEFLDAAVELLGETAVKYLGPYLEAGWNKKAESDSRLDKATSVTKYLDKPVDYGTEDAPNRVSLGMYFATQLASGKRYERITQARNEAGALVRGTIEPGTQAAKAVDEAVEQGVVRVARSIVAGEGTKLEKFDKLLELYERQPRLAVRTGTSMREQAYSTPAPLAYLASILTNTEPGTVVYDSSAGNGMLLIGTDTQNAIANEINPDRAEALRALGYTVNQGDGTKYSPERTPDRVIINPPFGQIDNQTWNIGGLKTNLIDHAIVVKSLESLPENGKAVLIIAAKGFEKREPKSDLERGGAYANEKPFYDHVYNNYNVTDHFTVHGDLYSKQGASFPVDVIVIDGRGQSKLPKPNELDRQNAVPRVYESWEDLRNVAERHLDTGNGRPSDLSTDKSADDFSDLQTLLEGQDSRTGGRGARSGRSDKRRPGLSPGGDAADQGTGGTDRQPTVPGPRDTEAPSGSEQISNEGQSDEVGRRDFDTQGMAGEDTKRVGDVETEFQTTYVKRSKLNGVGTLVPRTQAAAVAMALQVAEDRYGDLDEFVAEQLGYSLQDIIDNNYFSAEQMDALALNIARHKEGKAFVLGDQTGVGKGRVAAGMMVYAKNQGLVPVFMTESPSLYADMYRDLADIGRHSETTPFRALATNTLAGDKAIELPDGSFLRQSDSFAKTTIMNVAQSVANGKGPVAEVMAEVPFDKKGKPLGKTKTGRQRVMKVKTPREFDAIFTTYDQMQTIKGKLTDRHNALQMIAPNAFFILDESHNAGGSASEQAPTVAQSLSAAQMIRGLLDVAQGASFLSATYAKRVQVMDLYSKTGISESIAGGPDALIKTLVKGGVPLQQVLSEMLVESGAYMRRERSFDGVKFDITVTEPKVSGEPDPALEAADEVATLFNAINDLDRIKNEIVKSDRFKAWLVSSGLLNGKDVATGQAGAESSNFSSIMHNLVDQMLLSIKADATADAAIEAIKRGESPVIGLSNTMGAALDNYLDLNPANFGDEIDFRFNTMASRYLERSREVLLYTKLPDGTKVGQQFRIPDSVLGDRGVAAYDAARELVENFASDLPASPIDHIRHRLQQANITVAEITGRSQMIDYSEGKMRLIARPSEEMSSSGKNRTVKGFNNGTIQVMILNQSGSTGLSAHASPKFKNVKRRHMIIAQADKNIDTFMQMLGRIHRTGQLSELPGKPKGSNLPRYTLLMSNVPAETRPAAVLVKKLASLNANVTADSKGSVSFDVPDIFNSVGDRIVSEYLAENMELNRSLDDIVEVRRDGTPKLTPGIARKASGHLARMPVSVQREFWDSISKTFNEEIANLNALGKNPLQAAKLDLGAEVLERVQIFDGDPQADSPFLQPAFADRARVKKQGKPHTAEEIREALQEVYRKAPTHNDIFQWGLDQRELIDSDAQNVIDARVRRMREPLPSEVQEIRREMDNRISAVKNAVQRLAPGKLVYVSEAGDTESAVTGVVISLKPAKGKAHTPSGWTAVVSIASPDRIVRVPLTRVDVSEGAEPGEMLVQSTGGVLTNDTLSEWTDSTDVYEERILGTGNILAAFDQLSDSNKIGSIVFFTDKDGNSQRGVLMSRSFTMEQWQQDRPAIFKTADQVLQFLNMGTEHQVNSPDFSIQLTMDGSTLVIRSPISSQKSGKYTKNSEIIEASGTDFASVGRIMQMKISDRKSQTATIAAILNVGTLSTGRHKEVARLLIDPSSDPTAAKNLSSRLQQLPDVLYQTEEPVENFAKEVSDIAKMAKKQGIKTYDDFIAFVVEQIGERRTRMLGQWFQRAGEKVKFEGVRPTKEVLGEPTVTRDQVTTMLRASKLVADDQFDEAMQVIDAIQFDKLPGGSVGFAPEGTPVPGQSVAQNQEQNGNVKGWTKFISATRAIIGATDKADFSTFIHELFHPMRRFLLDRSIPLDKRQGITDEDLQALEDYAGVKDGNWTVAAEEKAAKAWEQYWLEGKSPTSALQALFEKIARWMRDVYQGVQQITGNQLTPQVRALFDKIVQRGFPDGFKMPPPFQGPGAPPVDSESHPEKLERIFPNRYDFTAMGKGVMNYLRELEGIPGLETLTKETVAGWVQQAEITLAADPYAAERLYRDVAASDGRPLDQHEVTLLAFHYRKLANDAERSLQESIDAAESGDPARIAQAKTEFIRTRQPMTEFEEVTYASKSAMGRAFYALQVMLRQDFTVGGLMKRAQSHNHGKPLSDKQKDEMTALAKQIDDLQKEVDRLRNKYEREEADAESQKQHDDVTKDAPRPRPKPTHAQKTTLGAAWDRFKSFTGIDTLFQQESPYEGVSQAYRDIGVTSFAELMRHVQERVGKEKAKELRNEFRTAWKNTSPDIDIAGVFDIGDGREMTRLARSIQRDLVEGGFRDRLEIIEAVREEMSQRLEMDVTSIQAMDWLSGYGQFSTPSKAGIEPILRKLNTENLKNRQIIQLGDALARVEQLRAQGMTDQQIGDQLVAEGMLVKPTGPQRDRDLAQDIDIRALQREYNDLKAQIPVSTENREGMLQTRLGAVQRGLANRIADIKEALATGTQINNERRAPLTSPEIEDLRSQLAEAIKDYREMFPKKPLSEAQRIHNAVRAAERSIAAMEKQIASKNFDKPKSLKVSSPELDALEAQKTAMRAQIDALKALEISKWEGEGGALTDDNYKREAAIRKNYIASVERRIAEYERIIAEKDFAKKPKVQRKLTREELDAGRRLDDAHKKALDAMARYHVENLKGLEWGYDKLKETAHLSRAIMTMGEAGALMNQGALAALGRPGIAKQALVDTALSLWRSFNKDKVFNKKDFTLREIESFLSGIDSRQAEYDIMTELTSGEWAETAIRAGLQLPTSDQDATRQEEVFQGRWGRLFPGVAFSGRLYTMILNKMRRGYYDSLANSLAIGGKPTFAESQLIAHFVNITTGRSDLKGVPLLDTFEKHAEALNAMFFATRFFMSRFQYLALPFYLPFTGGGVTKSWRAKRAIIHEMARSLIGIGSVIGAAAAWSMLFWDEDDEDKPTIGRDPTTSDFMKVKIGDTRIDFAGGLQQAFVLLSRLAQQRSGDTKFGEGYPPKTNLTVLGTFLRTKLAPVPGYVVTGLNNWEDVVGNTQTSILGFETHPAIATLPSAFIPMFGQTVWDAMKEHDAGPGILLSTLAFFGVRVGTYGPKTKYAYSTQDERKEQLVGFVKRMTWDSPDPAFKDFLSTEEVEQVQARRENRKQSLVNDALHEPERSSFKDPEDYDKAVAKRDKAIEAIRSAGWNSAEVRQLLLDYWKSNHGSTRRLQGGMYVLKDQVRERLRRINKVFGGVPVSQ